MVHNKIEIFIPVNLSILILWKDFEVNIFSTHEEIQKNCKCSVQPKIMKTKILNPKYFSQRKETFFPVKHSSVYSCSPDVTAIL